MSQSPVRFGAFRLDPANRRPSHEGSPVELNARYLDALILLVCSGGELVTKDRFMDEVWRGVHVTDEALTQAIRTLRRSLGDSAIAPCFIETAPKHGYRFIASIEGSEFLNSDPAPVVEVSRRSILSERSVMATLCATHRPVLTLPGTEIIFRQAFRRPILASTIPTRSMDKAIAYAAHNTKELQT